MIKISIQDNLSKFALKLKNYKPIGLNEYATDIEAIRREQIESNFANEQDSDGNKWARLAPSTIKARARQGAGPTPILQLRGLLKQAAINADIKASGSTFQASISDPSIAKFARFIESGTSKMPARPFFSVGASFSARVLALIADKQSGQLSLLFSDN